MTSAHHAVDIVDFEETNTIVQELKGKADAETSEQQFAEVWNQLHRQQSMMERLGSLESQFAGMGNLRQEFEEHRQEAVGRLQQCEQHGGMLKRVMEQMRDSTNDRLKDIGEEFLRCSFCDDGWWEEVSGCVVAAATLEWSTVGISVPMLWGCVIMLWVF